MAETEGVGGPAAAAAEDGREAGVSAGPGPSPRGGRPAGGLGTAPGEGGGCCGHQASPRPCCLRRVSCSVAGTRGQRRLPSEEGTAPHRSLHALALVHGVTAASRSLQGSRGASHARCFLTRRDCVLFCWSVTAVVSVCDGVTRLHATPGHLASGLLFPGVGCKSYFFWLPLSTEPSRVVSVSSLSVACLSTGFKIRSY